jgi:hypothetical protein
MAAYERANLVWPFNEHFQRVDSSSDPSVAAAQPPTPAMIAITAENKSTLNRMFDLETELAELKVENEQLHSNYTNSILQIDEDRLNIKALNAEIKKLAAERDSIQKKSKTALLIASAKSKSATSNVPMEVEVSTAQTQTEAIQVEKEIENDGLKEFQNNQRLQSVAGLMLRQLESRSAANKLLQQSLEDTASGLSKGVIDGENIKNQILQVRL